MRRSRSLLAQAAAVIMAAASGCADDPGHAPPRGDAAAPQEDAGLRDASRPRHDAAAADRDARTADAADAASGHDAGPITGDDYVDFGALHPSARGLVEVALEVPPDALSFVLSADPGDQPRDVALLELRGPSGELLFDGAADGPQPFDPASRHNSARQLPYAWMLPSSPQWPLAPGRYRIALYVAPPRIGEPAPLALDAVFALGRAADAPRPLALVLWSVAGAALDATTAAADPQLNGALAVMAELYAQAGLTLAPASFRDLDDPAAPALAVLDGDVELAQLLALLAAQSDGARALDVVLVDELAPEPGKTVLAKVSGLPGPPAHPALLRRGAVILPLAALPANPQRAGALLAHECAHYLGLRHTSEYDGLRHDPIADTPECLPERASQLGPDGQPLLSAEDCADQGGDNVLFYTPPRGGGPRQELLSAGQAYVLARHPLVR